MIETIQFTLNDQPVGFEVDPERTLLWVLRTDWADRRQIRLRQGALRRLHSAGGQRGGASMPAYRRGRCRERLRTIEGLAKNGQLHPIQQAFVQHDALQCGFCTPGMILKAYSLLLSNPDPPVIRSLPEWTTTSAAAGLMSGSCRPSKPHPKR